MRNRDGAEISYNQWLMFACKLSSSENSPTNNNYKNCNILFSIVPLLIPIVFYCSIVKNLLLSTIVIGKLASLNRLRQSNKGTFRASGLAGIEHMPSQSRVTGHRFRLSPTTLRGRSTIVIFYIFLYSTYKFLYSVMFYNCYIL